MTPRFSLVYPTRHRPAFLAQALALLEQQTFKDFDVIVSDNWIDPALTCEAICTASPLPITYVRPSEPVGMVANWNFATGFATGDYVCVFTDKMFLLPDALARISRAIDEGNAPEIVSWVSDGFEPTRFPDYFGAGTYSATQADLTTSGAAIAFDPRQALNEKGEAACSRGDQTPSQYCRGKLVFGAYSRDLIARIVQRFGQLFHDISPDYTSMILGLSEAKSAVELKSSAVVSIATDLSNGQLGSVRDQYALAYLTSLSGDLSDLLGRLLVPGMYAAQHNVVSHDYLTLKRQFDLDFAFNGIHWLGYCIEDLSLPNRVWSSTEIEHAQSQLMYDFVAALSIDEQKFVVQRLEQRMAARNAGTARVLAAGQQVSWPVTSLADAIARRSSWS